MRRAAIAVWVLAAGLAIGLVTGSAPLGAQSPAPASASSPRPAAPPGPSATTHNNRLSEAERIAILQHLIAVAGTARLPLPMDSHGVELSSTGQVLNADHVVQSLVDHGPADKVGERVVISNIEFKGGVIVVAINGGPLKTHWWDHLAVGMNGASNPLNQLQRRKTHGAQISIHFPHDLPALTPEQVKAELQPLVDWAPANVAAVMVQPLPSPVKAAIAHHQVMVGMNTSMVIAALGRTNNKIRQTDPIDGSMYENWIYGHPPAPTIFVRVVGDRVVRVTTWRSDGTETVDSTLDPALADMVTQNSPCTQGAGAAPAADDNPAPTLRRAGDPAAGEGGPGIGGQSSPQQDPDGLPPNGLPPGSGEPMPGASVPGFPGGAQNPGMPGPGMPGTGAGMPGAGMPNPGMPGTPSAPGFPNP